MTQLNLGEYDIAFPGLGIDKLTVKSEAFTIFGVSIMWYGILIALGMVLAILFGFSQMKKYGIDPDRAVDVIIGGIIGGVVGARLYYVAMNWDSYKNDIKSIFYTRNGGLAVYGGLIGALLVGIIICKIRKVKILPLFDIAGMGFLIGQGIGRWGNFFNHEAFGYNTDLPWGMTSPKIQQWIIDNNSSISSSSDIVAMSADKPVHPCFLYESLWCLIGFVVLFLLSKKRKYDGQMFLAYILWYGAERAVVEGLRTDSLMVGNVRISQVIAIVSAAAALILLIVCGSKVRRMGVDYVFYKDTQESKDLIAQSEAAAKKSKKTQVKKEESSDAEDKETEDSKDNTKS
ncbi:MAG: prolipoprotein diacylglyceryl transferase [Oscillospiraceae bacterium]|nr:prolipoprotein diacylglyceryl transferase [Oscillospiraceae bacterium]